MNSQNEISDFSLIELEDYGWIFCPNQQALKAIDPRANGGIDVNLGWISGGNECSRRHVSDTGGQTRKKGWTRVREKEAMM